VIAGDRDALVRLRVRARPSQARDRGDPSHRRAHCHQDADRAW